MRRIRWLISSDVIILMVIATSCPSGVDAETQVIPSLSFSERYDSNIYFAPQSFVPGAKLWDFVTAARPKLALEHRGRLVKGRMSANATGNLYVNNPGLNYVSTNATGNLNMDELIRQFLPGARLSVDDTFLYTPQPPSFLTPGPQIGATSPYIIGVQAFRANSYSNTASVTGTYPLWSSTDLEAAYSNSFRHFGSSFVTGAQGTLLNSTYQTATGGLVHEFTPRDKAKLSYTYAFASYDTSSFTTHNASVSYTRMLTPLATLRLTNGATVVSGQNSLNYTGTASLLWEASRTDTLNLSYTRTVSPSFFLATSALLSNVGTVGVTRRLSQRVTATASVNYAKSEAVPTPVVKYRSYGGSASLDYQFTPLISGSLAYSYSNFKNSSQGSSYEFDRNVVTFSLQASWR